MDLCLDISLGEGLKSASQRTRRMTEDWVTRNLFCLACGSNYLHPAPPNTPVFDHSCPGCCARYQIKGQKRPFGKKVLNSEYQLKLKAILDECAPHYAFLNYTDATWKVTDLFLVPGHFLGRASIKQRPPLKPSAKRAGWIGSQILLDRLPKEARVHVVRNGVCRSPSIVRQDWKQYKFLSKGKGWTADILSCIYILETETGSTTFTLQEFYKRFEQELASWYPENQHIQPKIRQQLQILRDQKIVTFLGKGRYRIGPSRYS